MIRFRHNAAVTVAGAVAAIGAVPLATQMWYLAPVILIPLTVAIWGWRAGTDVDTAGLRVHALLGSRFIPWTGIRTLSVGDDRRVYAETAGGGLVRLTAVPANALPRLVEAGGQRLPTAPETPPG